jgi:hypothetical protein
LFIPIPLFLPQFLPGLVPNRTAVFAVRSRKKLNLIYISIKIHFMRHRENLVFPT